MEWYPYNIQNVILPKVQKMTGKKAKNLDCGITHKKFLSQQLKF
jgi:hypothetical protein